MGTSLWNDIKKTVKDGVSVAAEKTEEYTRIGKLKVEILTMKRNIDKTFTELGRETYTLLKGKKKTDLAKNEKLKKLLTRIDEQKAALKGKEAAIEALRSDESNKSDEIAVTSTPQMTEESSTKKTKKKSK